MLKNIHPATIGVIIWIVAYIIDGYKNPKKMIRNFILGTSITFLIFCLIIGLILKLMSPNQFSVNDVFNVRMFFESMGIFCALYLVRKVSISQKNKK